MSFLVDRRYSLHSYINGKCNRFRPRVHKTENVDQAQDHFDKFLKLAKKSLNLLKCTPYLGGHDLHIDVNKIWLSYQIFEILRLIMILDVDPDL